ncbi:MAG: Spy/CpxP family protein refolding chaperone [Tangfeifania sp.]
MITRNKYRILVWIVVILVVTNLSVGISYLYHNQQDKMPDEQVEQAAIEIPTQQRARFFREQLNLSREQVDSFRVLNRDFNRTAWNITHELQTLRFKMVQELGVHNPNREKLDSISSEIGMLHKELKNETINYYLALRKVCDENQQQKLNDIFMAMLQKNEDIKLPRGGRMRNRIQQ